MRLWNSTRRVVDLERYRDIVHAVATEYGTFYGSASESPVRVKENA